MLLENRHMAVEQKLNDTSENLAWKVWMRAMLSRRIMNMGGAAIKNKMVNKLFHENWVNERGELQFAGRTFNRMWKDGVRM